MKLPREDILRHIWSDKFLTNKNLRSVDGEKIKILSFGSLQRTSGPDFRNAEILIENKKLVGDVEFHNLESGWNQHGHDEDENYNNVILHVVYIGSKKKFQAQTKSNLKIPVLEISNYIKNDLEKIIESLEKEEFRSANKFIPCYLENDLLPKSEIENAIQFYFEERVKNKLDKLSKRFSELHNSEYKLEQLFYEELFEALGYSNNKLPMRKLAININLEKFFLLRQNCELNIATIEAVFLHFGGFLIEKEKTSTSAKIKLHEVKSTAFESLEIFGEKNILQDFKLTITDWTISPTRPANSPQIRIAAGSKYVYQILNNNLFLDFIEIIGNRVYDEQKKLNMLIDKLKLPADEFWENHYSLNSATVKSHEVIGENRILDIIVNVVLPISIFYGKLKNNFILIDNAKRIFLIIPKMESNSIVQKMQKQLIKGKLLISKGFEQQGILEIYKNLCVNRLCGECLIGKNTYGNK